MHTSRMGGAGVKVELITEMEAEDTRCTVIKIRGCKRGQERSASQRTERKMLSSYELE